MRFLQFTTPRSSTILRKKPSLDFSLNGIVYAAMMLFMGLAAINSKANLLFAVFGLMIGVLLVSGTISKTVLRRLSATRVIPEHATVGQRTCVEYTFTNKNRYWPTFSVCLAELESFAAFTRQPQTYLLHCAAGTTAHVPCEVIPKRRGLYQLNQYQLSTSFPFGFIKRAVTRNSEDTLLVYPAIGKVEANLLKQCLSAEQGGSRMRPRRGGHDEFYGVKEYRSGENPRFINWRRSARTGQIVSNEMTQVAPPRLFIFVDTSLRERTVAQHAAIERTIAMAASLINHALEAGLAVGLFAWSDEWIGINPSRGKRHSRDLLTLLACLPLNLHHSTSDLVAAGRNLVRSATTAILFTPHDIQPDLLDNSARTNWIVIPAASTQANAFNFDPTVNFKETMPAEQDPANVGEVSSTKSQVSSL